MKIKRHRCTENSIVSIPRTVNNYSPYNLSAFDLHDKKKREFLGGKIQKRKRLYNYKWKPKYFISFKIPGRHFEKSISHPHVIRHTLLHPHVIRIRLLHPLEIWLVAFRIYDICKIKHILSKYMIMYNIILHGVNVVSYWPDKTNTDGSLIT